ncbi:hypothetical protein F0562_003589 [Nyssa sinensis]|uniref:Retrovirus-related Pol polyprotein from transposon TNT 1-94 n=1 Tax=Nyssa sinensis TaxID=561372 RepID=A0A5J5BVV2_9ASTE|nr:hypothetical protein F0562_003589 [Nyssa sinensis]
MKSGESVTDYFSRTMAIVNKMRNHGDKTEDVTILEKILRSMIPKFNFVVCSIEEANDIEEFSTNELQSSLLVHEQKINQQENKEQALKASTENHSTPSRGDRGRGRGRGKVRGDNDRGNQQQYQHQDNQYRGRGRGGHYSTTYRPRFGGRTIRIPLLGLAPNSMKRHLQHSSAASKTALEHPPIPPLNN